MFTSFLAPEIKYEFIKIDKRLENVAEPQTEGFVVVFIENMTVSLRLCYIVFNTIQSYDK